MLEKGILRREGSNYRAALYLTDAGREAAALVCHRAALAVELAGQGFTPEDRAVFYRVLETITTNLQDLCKEGMPE